MYHSINIGDYNTWKDFFLVPESMPQFQAPTPKTNYQEIPGADGSIDLSTALTGDMTYSDRTGTIEFTMAKGHGNWPALYANLLNCIHGKRLKISLEDDPSWYYMGRFWVTSYSNGRAYPSITMSYTLEPYRYSTIDTDTDWDWDPFVFEGNNARDWYDIDINGERTITFEWTRKSTVPIFYFVPAEGNTTVTIYVNTPQTIYKKSYTVTPGEINKILDPNIVLWQGTCHFVVTGNGKLDISATERSL